MKWVIAIVALAALAGGGFAGWWKLTEFDRTADEAQDHDTSAWPILYQQPDDPRVIKAARYALHSAAMSNQHGTGGLDGLVEQLGPILDKQPASDDAMLVDVAAVLTVEGDVRVVKWLKRPLEQLPEAMASHDWSHLYVADGRIKALEQLKPKCNGALVYLLLVDAAGGPETLASQHLAAGVPPDGAPFVPLSQSAERVPPANDPRYVRALERRLHHFADTWSFENDLESLDRVIGLSAAPALDVKIVKALERAAEVPGAAKLAQRLIRDGDVELVRANASPKAQAVLLGARAGVEAVAAFVAETRQAYAGYDQWGEEIRANLDARTDARAKNLAALGEQAVPQLRLALLDEKLGVRRLASRTLYALSPKQWAADEAAGLRSGKLGYRDAKLVLEMAQAEPVQLEALFGCLAVGHEELTYDVTAFVTKKVSADVWVAAVFDNLAVGQQFPVSAVDAYRTMLTGNAGTQAAVATALQKKLDAAGGRPAGVYWLAKMLALEALKARGTKAERALVEKFSGDPTGYERVPTHWDRNAKKTVEDGREATYISELARSALAAIDDRL